MSTRVPNVWDDDEISQSHVLSPVSKGVKPTAEKVRDEWDEDDEEDQEVAESASLAQPEVESTRRVLSEQPKTPAIIKPQMVLPFNGGSAGSSFPPELSFEPPVRILKRPKPDEQLFSGNSSGSNDRKTLQEREEKYRLARERIFGSSPSPSHSTPSTPNRLASPVDVGRTVEQSPPSRDDHVHRQGQPVAFVRPVREPLGPGTHTAFSRRPAPGQNASLPPPSAT